MEKNEGRKMGKTSQTLRYFSLAMIADCVLVGGKWWVVNIRKMDPSKKKDRGERKKRRARKEERKEKGDCQSSSTTSARGNCKTNVWNRGNMIMLFGERGLWDQRET